MPLMANGCVEGALADTQSEEPVAFKKVPCGIPEPGGQLVSRVGAGDEDAARAFRNPCEQIDQNRRAYFVHRGCHHAKPRTSRFCDAWQRLLGVHHPPLFRRRQQLLGKPARRRRLGNHHLYLVIICMTSER